jgi:hypothetical protein
MFDHLGEHSSKEELLEAIRSLEARLREEAVLNNETNPVVEVEVEVKVEVENTCKEVAAAAEAAAEEEDAGGGGKKKKNRKPKKKKNGYKGVPYDHKENPLPNYPELYADHPVTRNLTHGELCSYLRDYQPHNLRKYPYVVCAFLSPRNQIKQKEMFYFEKFVEKYPFHKAAQFMYNGMSFLGMRYGIKQTDIDAHFNEILAIEDENMCQFGVEYEYEKFTETFKEELEEEFVRRFGFQPTCESIKVLDAFESEQKAWEMIEKSRNYLESRHLKIFTGPVGEWMVFDPSDKNVEDKRYNNQEVAKIMRQVNLNGETKVDYFNKRMKARTRAAYLKNLEIAAKTGQEVTMEVDEEGNITKSKKWEVLADLPNRDVKPMAPRQMEAAAAGVQRIESVTQVIERRDPVTGDQIVDVVEGQQMEYSKF